MRDRAAEMWGDALRGAACRLTGPGCSPHSLAPLSPKASPSVCWSSVTRTQPQRPPRPQGNPGKPRAAGAPPWGGEKGSRGGARGEPASPRPPRSSRPESRPPTRPACSSLIYPARPGRGAWGEGEAGHPHPPHTHTHTLNFGRSESGLRLLLPLVSPFLGLSRSLSLCSTSVSLCFQDSRCLAARAGCRNPAGRDTIHVPLSAHSAAPLPQRGPPPPARSRPSAGRHGGREWGAGGQCRHLPGPARPGPGCALSLSQRKRPREGKCVVKVTGRGNGSQDSNPRPDDPRESWNCFPWGETGKQTELQGQKDRR